MMNGKGEDCNINASLFGMIDTNDAHSSRFTLNQMNIIDQSWESASY